MPGKRRVFSPEFKDEAVKLVIDSSRGIAEVAREIGVNEGTLGNWVNKYRTEHADEEPPLSLSERARLRELERENRELRMKTEPWEKQRPSSPRSIGECEVRAHRRAEGELPGDQDVCLARRTEVRLL